MLQTGMRRVTAIAGTVVAGLLVAGCNSSTGAAGNSASGTNSAASQHKSTPGPSSTTAPTPVGVSPQPARSSREVSALSCHDVERAFIMSDVAVTSIEDDTAGTQKAARQGTLPFAIVLHCVVRLPGYPHPQHVQLDRTAGDSAALVTKLGTFGHGTPLPAAQGYGAGGYLLRQDGGTYAVIAGKSNWLLDVGQLRHAADVEHIAHYLLGRL